MLIAKRKKPKAFWRACAPEPEGIIRPNPPLAQQVIGGQIQKLAKKEKTFFTNML